MFMDSLSCLGSFKRGGTETSGIHALYRRSHYSPRIHDYGDGNGQNSPPLSPNDTEDVIILRNALYCYHFLDTRNRGYISYKEADECLINLNTTKPELFKLVYGVLVLVKQYHNGENIPKDVFIRSCEDALVDLGPKGSSEINWMLQETNPLSEYFSALKQRVGPKGTCAVPTGSGKSTSTEWAEHVLSNCYHDHVRNPRATPNENHEEDSTLEDVVAPIRLKGNKMHSPRRYVHQMTRLKEEMQDVYHCKNGTGHRGAMNEYIVFHFNKKHDWSSTLRPLPSKGL